MCAHNFHSLQQVAYPSYMQMVRNKRSVKQGLVQVAHIQHPQGTHPHPHLAQEHWWYRELLGGLVEAQEVENCSQRGKNPGETETHCVVGNKNSCTYIQGINSEKYNFVCTLLTLNVGGIYTSQALAVNLHMQVCLEYYDTEL